MTGELKALINALPSDAMLLLGTDKGAMVAGKIDGITYPQLARMYAQMQLSLDNMVSSTIEHIERTASEDAASLFKLIYEMVKDGGELESSVQLLRQIPRREPA